MRSKHTKKNVLLILFLFLRDFDFSNHDTGNLKDSLQCFYAREYGYNERHMQQVDEELHKNILSCLYCNFMDTVSSSNDLLFHANGQLKKYIYAYALGKYSDPKEIDDFTIKVYAKLPKLSIPASYKNYEPDFAYLIGNKEGKKIFFVCETKGYDSIYDVHLKNDKK